MITRREFTRVAMASLAVPALGDMAFAEVVHGVRLGSHTYSFRDLPRPEGGEYLDVILAAMKQCGITDCELFFAHVEPAMPPGRPDPTSAAWKAARENVRRWRLSTPASHFTAVRKKLDAAGITPMAYNVNFNDSFTDAEIDACFEATRALGVDVLSVSTLLPVARRLAPFADRHQRIVAMHNHARVDNPDECATPESFDAMLALSRYFRLNLDIGHFTAANYDAVAYLRQHHDRVTHLHIKDRKKNQGDNMPWGKGDTPVREVLQLLKARKWPIPAMVEYQYKGTGSVVEEVTQCLNYAKKALA